MADRDDLIEAALGELGLLQGGQPVSAEDQATIDGIIADTLRDLASREICYVPDDASDIPVGYLQYLGILVAQRAAPRFFLQRSADSIAYAEQRLRRLSYPNTPLTPVRAEFW